MKEKIFSCKEEEVAFANFLVTKIRQAWTDDLGNFKIPNLAPALSGKEKDVPSNK